jgi:hypothetical protein
MLVGIGSRGLARSCRLLALHLLEPRFERVEPCILRGLRFRPGLHFRHDPVSPMCAKTLGN